MVFTNTKNVSITYSESGIVTHGPLKNSHPVIIKVDFSNQYNTVPEIYYIVKPINGTEIFSRIKTLTQSFVVFEILGYSEKELELVWHIEKPKNPKISINTDDHNLTNSVNYII